MNIFIDTISNPANITIFDSSRNIIDTTKWNVKGNESSTLIPEIDALLKKNKLEYTDLDNIVCVNGPGSFTGVRTTVLAINSINYIINKKITPMSYFDLFNTYPIIKSSSKRDCFVKFNENSKIEIIPNDELINLLKQNNITKINGEINQDLFTNIERLEEIEYLSIIKKLEFTDFKQIKALYIKKPNIS